MTGHDFHTAPGQSTAHSNKQTDTMIQGLWDEVTYNIPSWYLRLYAAYHAIPR